MSRGFCVTTPMGHWPVQCICSLCRIGTLVNPTPPRITKELLMAVRLAKQENENHSCYMTFGL